MKKLITSLVVIVILAVIFILLGPLYIVNEGEQAVVTRFGAIVEVRQTTGLKFKMPLIDTVVRYPKRILSWDGEAQRIPTRENQFIWVDTTARWKIIDPQRFYEAVGPVEGGYARLDDIIDSSVRTIISRNNLREAVRSSNIINEIDRSTALDQAETAISQDDIDFEELQELQELTVTTQRYDDVEKGREALSNEALKEASTLMPQFGIELIDVIIRQIRYSDELTESVFNRMIKDRNQIASAYRSHGEGKKAEWLGRLDNDRRRILSGAYEEAEVIKGTADARATSIYAQAYETDTEFFNFWRSIESYRATLPRFRKVITTDMDYFRYLYNQEGE
jgi:modulator of FtsH protease HflC